MTLIDTIELETNPETASYRHGLRRRWQTLRSQYEDAIADARCEGVADEAACSAAAQVVQGSIRALMSELLARAALPAVREFLATGHAGRESVTGLLSDREALLELVESAYPEPTWTALATLDRHEAEDDSRWLAWMAAWAEAFDASASDLRGSAETIAPTTVGKNDSKLEKNRIDMTIVDVSSKPSLSPRMQNIISLLTLAANAYVAADKCRQERLAGETVRPSTLEEVMAKSGLKIPGIQDALVQLMGGSEEAKKAASLLVNTPDLAELLRQLTGQFGGTSSNAIVTPPPAPAPSPSPAPGLIRYRPEFTSAAREAAQAPKSQQPPLARFRPGFTREAREAAAPTTAVSPSPNIPRAPVAAEQQAQLSLVAKVQEQLDALRRQVKTHEAERDSRLNRAESELVVLQREIQERPVADQVVPRSEGTSRHAVEAEVEPPDAEAAHDFDSEEQSNDIIKPDGAVDLGPPLWPAAASEQEVAQAIELVSKFAGEIDAHHQRQLQRVVSLERTMSTMRALVHHGHNPEGASPYG